MLQRSSRHCLSGKVGTSATKVSQIYLALLQAQSSRTKLSCSFSKDRSLARGITRHPTTVNRARAGYDELVVSRPKSYDAARDSGVSGGGPTAETDAAAAARVIGGGAPPPPAFSIPSPPLASFARQGPNDDVNGDDDIQEEVDFTASRGKEMDGIGGSGSGSGGGGGIGDGSQNAEHAGREAKEHESLPDSPPTPNPALATRTASLSASSSRHSLIAAGGKDDAESKTGQASAQATARGVKPREKREERSGVRLSDARGGFIITGGTASRRASSSSSAAAGHHRRDRSSMDEPDEIPGEGDEEETKGGGGARRRGSGASSFGYGDLVAEEAEAACYDSAGDWASDGSDGLPAAAGRGARGPKSSSLLSRESVGNGDSDAGSREEEEEEEERGAARAGQSAGESALEEEHVVSSELTVGQGTAPPRTETPQTSSATSSGGVERRVAEVDDEAEALDPPPPPPPATGGMSPGRVAAMAAAAERRKQSGGGSWIGGRGGGGGDGGGGGGGRGDRGSVRDMVAAFSAKSGGGGAGRGIDRGVAGGSSVKNRVTMFSAAIGEPGRHGGGDSGGGDADAPPPRGPSLALHVSTDTADDDDASSQLGGLSPRRKPPVRPQVSRKKNGYMY